MDCAIGLLPGLLSGQTLKNGEYYNIKKNDEGSVTIAQGTSFKDEMAIDVCRKFSYYLNGINEMMMQRIISFHVNGMTYYIPFVELVRSLFASSTFFSNGLLRPNYLGLSIENYKISAGSLDIRFAGRVPVFSSRSSRPTKIPQQNCRPGNWDGRFFAYDPHIETPARPTDEKLNQRYIV